MCVSIQNNTDVVMASYGRKNIRVLKTKAIIHFTEKVIKRCKGIYV